MTDGRTEFLYQYIARQHSVYWAYVALVGLNVSTHIPMYNFVSKKSVCQLTLSNSYSSNSLAR